MIGLWTRRGTWPGRAAGEIVPGLVGLVAGALAVPLLGGAPGVALGLLVWALVSALLARLRRHPWPRRIYRLAVLFWVVFGVWTGSRESVPRPSGPPVLAARVAWSGVHPFRAGIATVAFDVPSGATLAGWGGAPRRRTWPAFGGLGPLGRLSLSLLGPPRPGEPPRAPLFHDPAGPGEALGARALVLRAEEEGERAFALLRLDLVSVSPDLAEEIRAGTASLGLDGASLLVAATHTHSGPGGFHPAPLAVVAGTDHFDTRVRAAVCRAGIRALEEAFRQARPARLAAYGSRDRGGDGTPILARNRFDDRDPIDDRVTGLRIEDRSSGRILAVVLNYAVQPVILRAHHQAFGRDLVGALEDAVSAALPDRPAVLFLNGALGDQSPRGTYGNGPEAARRLAAAFAARIRDDVLAPPAAGRLRLAAARVAWDGGSPHTFLACGSRPAFARRVVPTAWGRDLPGHVASLVALPVNALAWSLGLFELRFGFTFEGAGGVVVNLEEAAPPRQRQVGGWLLETPAGEAGAIRRALLWQGGIATQAVGRRWRRSAAARGLEATPLLVSLANDSTGYVTTPAEYDRSSYEAESTLLGRDAALGMEAAFGVALDALVGDPRTGGDRPEGR